MIYCEECCEPVVIDRPCEHSIVCDGQLLGPESIPWDHYMPKVTAVGIRSLLADQLREAYAAECEVNHER